MMTEEDVLKRIEKITQDTSKQDEIHRTAVKVNEFIKGNQWIELDTQGKVRSIERDEEYFKQHRKFRPRPVVNQILPIYKTYLAYLIKTRARFIGKPESVEDVLDIIGARIATKLVEYFYQTIMVNDLYMDLCNTAIIYGTAFSHEFWNTATKMCDMVCIPPDQIFPYPANARKWENVREIVWVRSQATDIVQEDYPNLEIYSDEPSGDFLRPLEEENYNQEGNTTIFDYWKKPNSNNPGCMARVASKQFLATPRNYPYKTKDRKGQKRLTFTPYYDNYTGSGLWGFSTIGQALDLQQSLNDGKSVIQRLREIFPKLLIDKASKIEPETMKDPDADFLEYEGRMGNQPVYTKSPQPSNALLADVPETKREIEHVTGMHEVFMRGTTSTAIQSGEGIQQLRMGDELRILPALEWLRRGKIRSFENLYQLGKQFLIHYPEKLKQILGEMGEIDILSFKDIGLIAMNFTIEEASFSPFAEESRRREITALLPYGIIRVDDPRERRIVLKYFSEKLASDIDVLSRDERLQKMENKLMLEGKRVPINEDDNDEVHLDGVNVIRKDFRFPKLFKKIRDNFNAHYEWHQTQYRRKWEEARAAMRQDTQRGQPTAQPTEGA